MIIGIGTDMIEIDRVERAVYKESFLKRYFTEKEILRYSKLKYSAPTIAADFAAKEAVVKAMGTGFSGFTSIDIELDRDSRGKPFVCMYGRGSEICSEKGIDIIHVSLSHTNEYASAFAVAEGKIL